ncbi:MAG: CBS domain-containing protein [Nitrosopumilus sp.]|nr:CBS domain-containing protein [Nitrosopumilus sp.]MDH3822264.1 CBS domain-containing protein [Nitrosopumilus sp.]MDH3833065.1 CBS domain-containing protein [Nitrosopumilus sp.]
MVIEESANLPAKEIMNPNVVSVGPNETLREISELMNKQKIGSVVVIDNDKAVGIITERDFATKIMIKPYFPDTKVSDVMSSPVIYVSPNQSVSDIIDIMANREIRKVPVIDNGKIVGIVSGTEFLRLFVQTTDADIKKIYQQYVKRIFSNWFED